MDRSASTLSPVSWSSYETGDHEDSHTINTLFHHLSPFDQNTPLDGTPSSDPSDHNSPLAPPVKMTKETAEVSDGVSGHINNADNSAIDYPVSSQNTTSNATGFNELQSLMDFTNIHISPQSYSSPENIGLTTTSDHQFSPDPSSQQNVQYFFQELFQNYSMNSLPNSTTQHSQIDALLMERDNCHSSLVMSTSSAVPNEVFRSPMPSGLDNNSNRSCSSTNTIGVSSTSDEFTPLLSPAVTPFDTINPGILPTSEFTMPVPYFDGYSSPSVASSHVDLNLRKDQKESYKSTQRSRKLSTTPVLAPLMSSRQSSISSSRIAKKSPLIRPSRRSSTKFPTSAASSPVISATSRSVTSENQSLPSESISPETVQDLSMPPPQYKKSRPVEVPIAMKPSDSSAAVTPASLMNLPERKDVEMLDSSETEIHLQNAVRATKNIAAQSATEPRKARSKGKFASPSILASGSRGKPLARSQSAVLLSPILPGPSPSSTVLKPKATPSSIVPSSAGSSPVWRSRPVNIQASPSLRPKMSPQISPRLEPGTSGVAGVHLHNHHRSSSTGTTGTTGTTDLSALLASKSNYQNIVEGNHNHLGLVYPEALSVDLTSKRTSHKLAEQGRRNRINSALADLGKVLPPAFQANSKASIVEMAIEYIQSLKTDLAQTKERLSKYESVDNDLDASKLSTSTAADVTEIKNTNENNNINGKNKISL